MRKNSIKNIRINAEVQRELSRIIQQEIKDPRIHPMTVRQEEPLQPAVILEQIPEQILGLERIAK